MYISKSVFCLLFNAHLAEYSFYCVSFPALWRFVLLYSGIPGCCWKDEGQFNGHVYVGNLLFFFLSPPIPIPVSDSFCDFILISCSFTMLCLSGEFVYSAWHLAHLQWEDSPSHPFSAISSLNIAFLPVPQFSSSRSLITCMFESSSLSFVFLNYFSNFQLR